jgi:hypothetical protein
MSCLRHRWFGFDFGIDANTPPEPFKNGTV